MYKMKKKGFTLIELLAVIVILAVVALISVPVIINIIENAKKGALRDSAYGLMDAANVYYGAHIEEIGDYVDFQIEDGKQISEAKLNYKGKVNNAYIRLVNAKKIALCVDDGKYYAVKSLDNNEIMMDEGGCSSEYDEDLLGFMTVGNASYIGTRLSVKAYTSKDELPNKSTEGYIGVITETKISDYYLSPTEPLDAKDGSVWVVLNNTSENYIITKNSKLGVSYVLQKEGEDWNLKEAYVYNIVGDKNGEWVLLSGFQNDKVWDFTYTGEYQTFKAPYSGYYIIELWGGGYSNTEGGAYTKGDIYLNTNEEIYIYVGGQPWNGGGTGYYYGFGATDVRTVATSAPNAWNEIDSLRSRIMVAAGSGGTGVAAGGLIGYTATATSYDAYCGRGATQTSGGASPITWSTAGSGGAGGFGYGGGGGRSISSGGSGSGGGGWYGGSGASGAGSCG